MLQQQLGDRLRGKITDDQTHNVSYYAQTYSKADYGTTHLAVLAPNGDAVSVTTTINHRSVLQTTLSAPSYNRESPGETKDQTLVHSTTELRFQREINGNHISVDLRENEVQCTMESCYVKPLGDQGKDSR